MALEPESNPVDALKAVFRRHASGVSVITMVELTKVYGQLASTYYDYLGIGLLTAAMYFVIGLPFVRLSRALEKRFMRGRQPLV